MRQTALGLSILVTLIGSAAVGQDYLQTSGRLSDEDFYRLVACRAEPGKGCTERMVRWAPDRAAALGIGLASVADTYPDPLARQMSAALDRVIAEINGAGAAVRLFRAVRSSDAAIRVHLVGAGQGEVIRGTGNTGMDGVKIDAALVNIRWNLAGRITRGNIAMASDVPMDEAYPILLEEVTQSLGLMTDIRNPHYRDLSVFSEDSNTVTRLSDQDIYALRRHYPGP